MLGDPRVLAAPRELHVHKYTFSAHLPVFHLKLFAWLHKDGERLEVSYYSDFVNVSDFMGI